MVFPVSPIHGTFSRLCVLFTWHTYFGQCRSLCVSFSWHFYSYVSFTWHIGNVLCLLYMTHFPKPLCLVNVTLMLFHHFVPPIHDTMEMSCAAFSWHTFRNPCVSLTWHSCSFIILCLLYMTHIENLVSPLHDHDDHEYPVFVCHIYLSRCMCLLYVTQWHNEGAGIWGDGAPDTVYRDSWYWRIERWPPKAL